MVEAVSRELILPAIRLDVPPRPAGRQLAGLGESSAQEWTSSPLTWATQQVIRLAVAAVLKARLEPGPGRVEKDGISSDPDEVTLAQLATLFRPHVGLSAQAFELALVEAVNSGVPAAVDPVREGLRRVGVTGREPLRIVALGLDKLPARARQSFWTTAKTSSTVTAVVDALADGRRGDQARLQDVSGLDRGELARADALVLGGGRMTPVTLSSRSQEGGSSWLQVPLSVNRVRGRKDVGQRGNERGNDRGVEVGLRGEAWAEVFDTALDAVGSAMQQIDQGNRPRGRTSDQVDALATRLVAAKERTVADVCASLRAIDPFVLEMFDHQVTTSSVPVAVPVIEDDLFVQLWLPTSALAGPLFTGAPDLFLGGAPDYRGQVGRPAGQQGRAGGRSGERPGGRDGGSRPGEGRRARGDGRGDGRGEGRPEGAAGEASVEGGPEARTGRRRKPRPPRGPRSAEAPGDVATDPRSDVSSAEPTGHPVSEPASAPSGTPAPTQAPEPTTQAPAPTLAPAQAPEPSPAPAPAPASGPTTEAPASSGSAPE